MDVGPNFIMALTMAFFVYILGRLSFINMYVLVCFQVIIGVVLYLTMAILFKNESYNYVYNYLKTRYLNHEKIILLLVLLHTHYCCIC